MGIEEVVDGKAETPAAEAPSEVVETPEAVVEAPAVVETPAPEVVAAPAVEPKTERDVPLPTFLDMRDRATAAERRLAELDKPNDAPEAPDPYDDPKGFTAHVERVAEAKATDNRFKMSDVIARREFGDEAVETAVQWAMEKAQADPSFGPQYMREAHPLDWIVRQHKEAADLDDYRKDPAAFARRILEAQGEAVPLVPVTVTGEQQQAPATPARSIASTPSTGGGVKDVPLHPLAALEATFHP